jgi:hypothetical protein
MWNHLRHSLPLQGQVGSATFGCFLVCLLLLVLHSQLHAALVFTYARSLQRAGALTDLGPFMKQTGG